MLQRVVLSTLLASPLAFLFAACGAGDVSPPPPIGDAGTTLDGQNGPDGSGGETGPGGTTQKGQIVDLSTKSGVAGATVTLGKGPVTADASGKYQGAVDPAKSFNMKVEKTGYYTLTEQETLVKADIDLGKTSLLSEATAS